MNIQAVFWMIGAIISFTSMAIAGRAVSDTLDTFEIMLYRSMIGFLIVINAAWIFGTYREINLKYLSLHILRNIFHFIGQNLWFFACNLINILVSSFRFQLTKPKI